ncbi:hypothetical protein PM082_012144 [Marasmius tenuissimus]|nr:hypothetical protein PM082_012144 [Marasmius tenuissimus]
MSEQSADLCYPDIRVNARASSAAVLAIAESLSPTYNAHGGGDERVIACDDSVEIPTATAPVDHGGATNLFGVGEPPRQQPEDVEIRPT